MKRSYLFLFIIFLASSQFLFAQKRPTGVVINKATIAKTPRKVQLSVRSFADLPSSYSLEKWAPTPGDQGDHGTCVAFANGYGLATLLYAKTHNITDKTMIDEYIFSPSYLYEQIKDKGDDDCQNGSDPIKALYTMIDNGDALMKTVPYNCEVSLTDQAKAEAINYKLSEIAIVFAAKDMLTVDDYIKAPDEIIKSTKKALVEGTPVSTVYYLPESFFHISSPVWETKPTDEQSDWKHACHAMLVVGYDDNKYGGAFRVMNSWGTNWGDGGYVWMRYNDFAKWCIMGIQAFPDPNTPGPHDLKKDDVKPAPDPNPAPDPAPDPYENVSITKLSGDIEFQTSTGDDMPVNKISSRNLVVEDEKGAEDLVAYTMINSYTSGTKFRFYMNVNDEAYIYAFATDLSGKVNRILPYDDLTSTHVGSNSVIAFPSDTKVIKLDANAGTDYLLILYSREQLDMNDMMEAMNKTTGGLSAKIVAALGDKLISKEEITYSGDKVGFEINEDASGSVVPLMVEIKHE